VLQISFRIYESKNLELHNNFDDPSLGFDPESFQYKDTFEIVTIESDYATGKKKPAETDESYQYPLEGMDTSIAQRVVEVRYKLSLSDPSEVADGRRFPTMSFFISLDRKPEFFISNIIAPMIGLTFLAALSFVGVVDGIQ